jgi:hypothetical protein
VSLEKRVSKGLLDILGYRVKLDYRANAVLTVLLAHRVLKEKEVLLGKQVILDYREFRVLLVNMG